MLTIQSKSVYPEGFAVSALLLRMPNTIFLLWAELPASLGSIQAGSVHEFQLNSLCIWDIGRDLSFGTTGFFYFLHTRTAISSLQGKSLSRQLSFRTYPVLCTNVLYQVPILTKGCMKDQSPSVSWFINWEAVVKRIRGKFQRAFPEGILPSPVSCLMLSSSGFLKGEIYP